MQNGGRIAGANACIIGGRERHLRHRAISYVKKSGTPAVEIVFNLYLIVSCRHYCTGGVGNQVVGCVFPDIRGKRGRSLHRYGFAGAEEGRNIDMRFGFGANKDRHRQILATNRQVYFRKPLGVPMYLYLVRIAYPIHCAGSCRRNRPIVLHLLQRIGGIQ